jgi:ankyrin repeat protein
VSAYSQAIMASRRYFGDSAYIQRVPRQMTGIHLAAYFGMREAVIALHENGHHHHPDSKDNDGRTPLSWAAGMGHEAVMKLLLAKDGVDLISKDEVGKTPLSWAARNGHEAVVKLLLATDGVDPDSMDNNGRTPLS